jgi:hypothetical protein
MSDLYCTVVDWCVKQGFDDFAAYAVKNSDYPTENALTAILEDATGLMNEEIGDLTVNITITRHLKTLRNLCYRMSNLMIDEEQGRAQEQRRSQYIPRDYMYERDRSKLHRIGIEVGARVVGAVG